jgi:hypothetical protein
VCCHLRHQAIADFADSDWAPTLAVAGPASACHPANDAVNLLRLPAMNGALTAS